MIFPKFKSALLVSAATIILTACGGGGSSSGGGGGTPTPPPPPPPPPTLTAADQVLRSSTNHVADVTGEVLDPDLVVVMTVGQDFSFDVSPTPSNADFVVEVSGSGCSLTGTTTFNVTSSLSDTVCSISIKPNGSGAAVFEREVNYVSEQNSERWYNFWDLNLIELRDSGDGNNAVERCDDNTASGRGADRIVSIDFPDDSAGNSFTEVTGCFAVKAVEDNSGTVRDRLIFLGTYAIASDGTPSFHRSGNDIVGNSDRAILEDGEFASFTSATPVEIVGLGQIGGRPGDLGYETTGLAEPYSDGSFSSGSTYRSRANLGNALFDGNHEFVLEKNPDGSFFIAYIEKL